MSATQAGGVRRVRRSARRSPPCSSFLGAAAIALLALTSVAAPAQAPGGAPTDTAGGHEAQAPAAPRRVPDDTALARKVKEVAAELRCPVCQGLSLADSPSELSQEMKDVVRDQLAAGKTPDEVKAYFVSKYGQWILMEPKAEGFNLVVYLLPFAMLAAGAGVIVLAVRRWTRAAPAGAPSGTTDEPADDDGDYDDEGDEGDEAPERAPAGANRR
jgi:cytochrome c-type biogenesis protein CcmH